MRIVYGMVFFFLANLGSAQHEVRFIVKDISHIKHDSIFIVGTFNNWDSLTNTNYLMQSQEDNIKTITLSLPTGPIEYKYHRGNWSKVEKGYFGHEIENRKIIIDRDTTLVDSVRAWRDQLIEDKKQALKSVFSLADQVPYLSAIAHNYSFFQEYYNIDSAFHYAQKAIDIQEEIISQQNFTYNFQQGGQLFELKEMVASLLHALGNYSRSLELRLENVTIAEKQPEKIWAAYAYIHLTDDFNSMKDFQNALKYCRLAESVIENSSVDTSDHRGLIHRTLYTTALTYLNLGLLDSALSYALKAKELVVETNWIYPIMGNELLLADIYAARNENQNALFYYLKMIEEVPGYMIQYMAEAKSGLAKVYKKEGRLREALIQARQAIEIFQNNSLVVQNWGESSDTYIAEISPFVADLYKTTGNMDSAYHYLELSVNLKDSLYNTDKVRQFQTLTFNEASRRQAEAQQRKEAQQQFQTRIKLYGLISGLVGALIIAFLLYRNNRQKQHANAQLQSQKQEIEKTLAELKNTQAQLIQSEKMASLGELTAGIAHEIQNPLNFVNNFSDVSVELLDEAMDELNKGDQTEVAQILQDLKNNLSKIHHHGARASGIVKGMLAHSRSGSDEKVFTDINALCEEYLRLAYHGMRAKDKSFNASFEADLDPDLPAIEVVPQEIGRVLLNLINNAFQAVRRNPADKKPYVKVSTKVINDQIEIVVADNGMGIPDRIKDKIFQPFYTTKPTGEGTGLGLSLSYDIVKAHGGDITLQSEEGNGSAFIINLPIS